MGGELGLDRIHLDDMDDLLPDMLWAWLRKDDQVTIEPSWTSLAAALEKCDKKGISDKIKQEYCS